MTVIIITSVILLINIILWIIVLRKIKKEFSVSGALQEIKQEINKLIIEISRETDRDVSLVEAKCVQLRDLLNICDKKIALLNKSLVQKEDEAKIMNILNEPSEKKNTKKTTSSAKKVKNPYNSNFQLFTDNAGTQEFQNNEEKSSPDTLFEQEKEFQIFKAADPIKPKIPLNDQIRNMINQGFTSELIAEKLNVSIGQVDLVKNLMK